MRKQESVVFLTDFWGSILRCKKDTGKNGTGRFLFLKRKGDFYEQRKYAGD